jgi:hypothetical protein
MTLVSLVVGIPSVKHVEERVQVIGRKARGKETTRKTET